MARYVHPFGFSSGACLLAGNVSWLQHFVLSFRHERKAATNTAFRNVHSPMRQSLWHYARQEGTATNATAARDPAKEPDKNLSPRFPNTKVVVPLAERDGKVVASATQVLEWRDWARSRAAKEWSGREDRDDGSPTLESLFTEVDWIVEDAVAGISDALSSGCDGAWRDMGRLVEGRGLQRCSQVLLREDLEELRRMWTKRLLERVPLQYITASCHWRDLVLVVTPAVLIPRPETELLIDFVADALKLRPELADSPWADLGTGSGALAIGVASEISKMKLARESTWSVGADEADALVHAVDLSHDAVVVARHNAERNAGATGGGFGGVRVHEGSWYEPLESIVRARGCTRDGTAGDGCFAGIVSNPPYIPSKDMDHLQPEVRNHEPWLALEGGPGPGMDAMVPICKGAAARLLPGGFLALETNGGTQAQDVAHILRAMRRGWVEDVAVVGGGYRNLHLSVVNVFLQRRRRRRQQSLKTSRYGKTTTA